jgi:cyclohexa-1,5-dienecarbonyl-CoA hydratase
MTRPLVVRLEAEDRLLRLSLARPKANLIDAEMIAALEEALARPAPRSLSAILIDAEGPSFSFGASVAEHLPGECHAMLTALHRLIGRILGSEVPVLVAAQGKCLGAGLELALSAHLLFVAPDAELGQPEIRLGVFAPAASCLLPELIGPSRAMDLLLSGRSISGSEAASLGLARQAQGDPTEAARAYVAEHLLPKSASSLRHAVRAARADFTARIKERLVRVEHLYLEELMSSRDANEGLNAFLARRPPQWEHR